MCPHIQLQNFISDKEPLIEEESLIFVDYDMPELIEDKEFYRDIPELDVEANISDILLKMNNQ